MELPVTTRTIVGKKTRALRREGVIPAEVYGHGVPNQHVSVPAKQFARVYREAGEHTIVTVTVDGKEKINTIIAGVAYDSLSGDVIAVDFHQIRMDEKIQTKVPVRFIGEPPAKKLGFPVVRTLDEIEIEALPGKLPHAFEVDLSPLTEPGQSIYIRDIAVPPDVKVLVPPETVIVTVGEQTKEEVAAPPPETPAAGEAAAPGAGEEEGTPVSAPESEDGNQ